MSVNPTTFTPLNTAVLFLVFNRLDTTKQVFEAIRLAKPPRLYIAADGARASREGEAATVQAVRDYVVNHIDWECEVKTLFREQNLGCKYAVSGAVTWFFENEEMGIILEDDCLPDPTFFNFCQEMLERYREDERIGLICGTNLASNIKIKESYYYSRYPHIWGWASWRRVWKKYDVKMDALDNLVNNESFKQSFNKKNESVYWADNFKAVKTGSVDTWDSQVVFMAFSNSYYSLYSNENIITNIGFGSEATHTKNPFNSLSHLPLSKMKFPLNHPQFIIQNFVAETARKNFEGIGRSRIATIIRSIFKFILNKLFR